MCNSSCKLLIFGCNGMLGSRLAFDLGKIFNVIGVGRNTLTHKQHQKQIQIDYNSDSIIQTIEDVQPDFVINCCGWIKQKDSRKSDGVFINTCFPHLLNEHSELLKYKLIHFSTDCVFDGKIGFYTEDDKPSANDFYGQTKMLGEVSSPNTITLRSSIIGFEVNSKVSLLEWFLSQNEDIEGYSHAYFNGVTTNEMANVVTCVIKNFQNGLFHVGSQKISKYNLLRKVKEITKSQMGIKRNGNLKINRVLNIEKFLNTFKYNVKTWEEMLTQMFENGRIK